jgi:hypothetical protein
MVVSVWLTGFKGFAFVFTLSESNLKNDLSKSLDVFGKYAQNQNVIKNCKRFLTIVERTLLCAFLICLWLMIRLATCFILVGALKAFNIVLGCPNI